MKIKRLVALALASTMVFSMAACGDKNDKKSSGNQAVNAEESEELVDTIIEAISKFTEEQDNCYAADTSMSMKMKAEEMEIYMDVNAHTSAFDGVTYTKSTSKTNMLGEDMEDVSEVYSITKEDGSVVTATKVADEDEWEVYEMDAEDIEETLEKLDVEAAKKTAKVSKDGDNYCVEVDVDAAQMGLGEDELFGDMSDFKVTVKATYNEKEKALIKLEVMFDLDALNEMMSSLGSVEITEFTMTVDNIKKNDKAIEIPAEIELD